MYYNFDFNKDSSFFENSKTLHFMKAHLDENKHLKNISKEIYNVSIQLWAESIIKHNLDLNMTSIDHLHLISEQNSKEVLKVIGSIMFKDKHSRTNEEFQTLRQQGMVANYLQLITLSVEEDVCTNLKKEFIEYQSLKLNDSKKPKIK